LSRLTSPCKPTGGLVPPTPSLRACLGRSTETSEPSWSALHGRHVWGGSGAFRAMVDARWTQLAGELAAGRRVDPPLAAMHLQRFAVAVCRVDGEIRTQTGDITIFSGPRALVPGCRWVSIAGVVRDRVGRLGRSPAGTGAARDVSRTPLLDRLAVGVVVVELCSAGSGQPDLPC
jgi:hypothetical protein